MLGWRFIGAAVGVLLAAGVIPSCRFVRMPVSILKFTGLAYGIVLSVIVVWGPWMSEQYPPPLRSRPQRQAAGALR